MKFSVVIPSYNQGDFIDRTLGSVYAQSSTHFDCYVADGGSQDQTLEILKNYAQKYTNFNWHSHPDSGQADAVNQGIAATTGEIIAWINSDDLYYAAALSQVQKIFLNNPDVLVVYGQANYIDIDDRILEPYPTQAWNYEHLKEICYLCQPAVFFRRTCIEQWGSLNPNLHFCLDYELWLRWGQHTDFYFLAQTLAGSRQYSANKTLGARLKAHAEVNQMLKQQLGYVPDRHLFNYARVQAESLLNLEPENTGITLHNRPLPLHHPHFWLYFLGILGQQYWHWRKIPSLVKLLRFLHLKLSVLLRI